MPKTNLQHHLYVDALPNKVWQVLTSPDYLWQYLFEGTIHCQWTEGSPLTLVTHAQGKTQTIHKGSIVQIVPGVLLQYDLNGDDASGCLKTTYELTRAGDGVELKIKCSGFNDSEDEYMARVHQIKLLLQKIKWLAEFT